MAAKDDIILPVSTMSRSIIESLLGGPAAASLVKAEPRKASPIRLQFADPNSMPTELGGDGGGPTGELPVQAVEKSLSKSLLNVLNGGRDDSIERLAFEIDPQQVNQYQSLYRAKLRLVPDHLLKRIAIQDSLVAAILNARSKHLQSFGMPPQDRFSKGFTIEPKPGIMDELDGEKKRDLQRRIDAVTERLITCGETKGWSDHDKLSLSTYMAVSVRNALTVGRIATEIVYCTDKNTGGRRFHSFRPTDAGTIYRACPQQEAAEQVRQQARRQLEQLKNKKLQPERFEKDEYTWIQVIDGQPRQAFTAEEMVVHAFYPATDVELEGYPLTPLDTVIAEVTTHINITTHNKLYFQSGRASRGMLIIKAEGGVDENVLARIRMQFNATINNVNNAWRMPVFGVGTDEEITWAPIDNGGRDMEFQYLSDNTVRCILSAFQMSPEELPGYAHLSRGTNNQALSESNNEYKLEAARDVGIRPLLQEFENFFNTCLFPLFDETLAKLCKIRFVGLDAETQEKESIRIQTDLPIHGTMDWILDQVEKKPVGKAWAGEFLLNPQWQEVLDKYFPVGQIMEHFFDMKGAGARPDLQYPRDPFWFQYQELLMQVQQAASAPPGGGGGGGGGPPGNGEGGGEQQPPPDDGGGGGPVNDGGSSSSGSSAKSGGSGGNPAPKTENQKSADANPKKAATGPLSSAVDQLTATLGKAEHQLSPAHKKLLVQQKMTVAAALDGFRADGDKFLKEVLDLAEAHTAPPAKE
jgi:hypothetical protein